MSFDQDLAERVRRIVRRRLGVTEKKMFGGLAFMIRGNMSVGVSGDELIVRIPPRETDKALKEPGVRVFDITGQPMRGWLLIGKAGTDDADSLAKWVKRGVDFANTLPEK